MLQHEIMIPKPTVHHDEENKLDNTFEVDSERNCCSDLKLKQELKQAAEHCQILAQKLCRNGGSPPTKQPLMSSPIEISSAPETELQECCRDQRLKTRATVAENIRLRQVLKDVTEINKRWQKYNKQQKGYIQRLQSTIDVLQGGGALVENALEDEQVPFRPPFKEEKDGDSLMDQSATLFSLKKSYENAVKENCRLQKELDELRGVKDVKAQNNQEAPPGGQKVALREAQEHAEMLSLQVRAHKEDWEAEKAEKEDAKQRAQQAEEDVFELKKKCQVYESRLQQIQEATLATFDGTEKKGEQDWRILRTRLSAPVQRTQDQCNLISQESLYNGQQLRVMSRGVSGRAFQESYSSDPGNLNNIELDGVRTTKSSRTSSPTSPMFLQSSSPAASLSLRNSSPTGSLSLFSTTPKSSPPQLRSEHQVLTREPSSFEMVEDLNKDVVSCPGCRRVFGTEQHLLFLDHFEECQPNKPDANEFLFRCN